jgi:hypothetical protein
LSRAFSRPQSAQLITLIRRQVVVGLVAIELVLAAPAQRLLRDAQALRQLARCAAGAQHLHRLAAKLTPNRQCRNRRDRPRLPGTDDPGHRIAAPVSGAAGRVKLDAARRAKR